MNALIESVLQIYRQISERLLQIRVQRSGWHSSSAPNIDIVEPLIARVRAYAKEGASGPEEQAAVTASDRAALAARHGHGEPHAYHHGATPPAFKPPLLPSELATQFAKEPRSGALLPPMGEQLKRRTFEYINHALELAKQGNAESAETYAKLAESALKTAADYLSADEYLSFANEVMSRVRGQGPGETPWPGDD